MCPSLDISDPSLISDPSKEGGLMTAPGRGSSRPFCPRSASATSSFPAICHLLPSFHKWPGSWLTSWPLGWDGVPGPLLEPRPLPVSEAGSPEPGAGWGCGVVRSHRVPWEPEARITALLVVGNGTRWCLRGSLLRPHWTGRVGGLLTSKVPGCPKRTSLCPTSVWHLQECLSSHDLL